MSEINCNACEALKKNAAHFVQNGITDTECNSLAEDTGLNPSLNPKHVDATDLHNVNDCLVGRMENDLEMYNACDWQEFMARFIPNLYETIKAIICALGGVWQKIHSLLSRVSGLETRMDAAESDIASLKTRTTNLESRMSDAENGIDGLKGRMSNAESDIAGIKNDMSGVGDRISALENLISSLSSTVAGNTTAINNLNTAVTSNTSAITVINEQLPEIDDEITLLCEAQNNALEPSLHRLREIKSTKVNDNVNATGGLMANTVEATLCDKTVVVDMVALNIGSGTVENLNVGDIIFTIDKDDVVPSRMHSSTWGGIMRYGFMQALCTVANRYTVYAIAYEDERYPGKLSVMVHSIVGPTDTASGGIATIQNVPRFFIISG